MAETSYPFDGIDTTEEQYRLLFGALRLPGVIGDTGGNILKVTADGSGRQVSVASGPALVEGYYYSNSALKTIDVDANSSGNPRIDTACLRLDLIANSILAVVKKGTPAGSPSAPAMSAGTDSVWELPLADIAVANGAASLVQANITDRRTYSGMDIGQWTTDTRPASPRKFQVGRNTTTNLWEYHDGTTWKGLGVGIRLVDLVMPAYSTLDGRTIRIQTTVPVDGDGANGDIWFVYQP